MTMNKEEFQKYKEGVVQSLNETIAGYKKAISQAHSKINDLEADIRNFVFDSITEAIADIGDKIREEASEACEGSYCMGNDVYTQEFIVGDTKYEAKAHVEYNRHDKRYYYVDEFKMTYKEIGKYET